jgi:hypothetical protein
MRLSTPQILQTVTAKYQMEYSGGRGGARPLLPAPSASGSGLTCNRSPAEHTWLNTVLSTISDNTVQLSCCTGAQLAALHLSIYIQIKPPATCIFLQTSISNAGMFEAHSPRKVDAPPNDPSALMHHYSHVAAHARHPNFLMALCLAGENLAIAVGITPLISPAAVSSGNVCVLGEAVERSITPQFSSLSQISHRDLPCNISHGIGMHVVSLLEFSSLPVLWAKGQTSARLDLFSSESIRH